MPDIPDNVRRLLRASLLVLKASKFKRGGEWTIPNDEWEKLFEASKYFTEAEKVSARKWPEGEE